MAKKYIIKTSGRSIELSKPNSTSLVIFWDGNKAFYEKVYDTKPEDAPKKAINSLLMVKDFDPDYVSTLEVNQVIKV